MQRVSVIAVVLLLAVAIFGQARGGRGSGQSRGGMGNTGGNPQASQGQRGSGIGDQQRQRIRINQQQQQQYRTCLQSTQHLRTQLRQMQQVHKGQAISPQQAAQWREQLRNRVRQMQQEHAAFMTGLGDQQAAAVQSHAEQARLSAGELEKLSDALGFALNENNLNSTMIAEKAQLTDKTAARLEKQYRAMGNELGIQPEKGE